MRRTSRAVIDGFAVSARNAIEAGFDGIEIKVAHDGLLRSFASPFFNHRTDGYGGSFENRMRFSLEVLRGDQARDRRRASRSASASASTNSRPSATGSTTGCEMAEHSQR